MQGRIALCNDHAELGQQAANAGARSDGNQAQPRGQLSTLLELAGIADRGLASRAVRMASLLSATCFHKNNWLGDTCLRSSLLCCLGATAWLQEVRIHGWMR